jgi:hypothetical protein
MTENILPQFFFPIGFFLNFSAVFYRRRSSWRTNGLKTGERPCLDKWRTTSHVLFKRKKKSNWTMDRTGINPNEEKSDMSLRPTEQLTCQKEGSTQFYVWTRAASSHFSVYFKSIETLFYYVSAFESKTTFSCCARNLNLFKYYFLMDLFSFFVFPSVQPPSSEFSLIYCFGDERRVRRLMKNKTAVGLCRCVCVYTHRNNTNEYICVVYS